MKMQRHTLLDLPPFQERLHFVHAPSGYISLLETKVRRSQIQNL